MYVCMCPAKISKPIELPFWGPKNGVEIFQQEKAVGGCPAHWKALGVCCGICSKRGHLVLINGTTCDADFYQNSLTICHYYF